MKNYFGKKVLGLAGFSMDGSHAGLHCLCRLADR